MASVILNLCKREKTNEQIEQFRTDLDELARQDLRALGVAIEDVSSKGDGNGFKLIGLIPIYDSPRPDARETIERALELGKNFHLKKKTSNFPNRHKSEDDHW